MDTDETQPWDGLPDSTAVLGTDSNHDETEAEAEVELPAESVPEEAELPEEAVEEFTASEAEVGIDCR